jgi:feruloyl esterase
LEARCGRILLLWLVMSGAQTALCAPLPCERLADAKLPDTRILRAEMVTPDPIWKYPPSLFTSFDRSGLGGVEKPFCRVVGVIEKEINFELWLPRDWNGKFEGVGNGGFTGAINYPSMGAALAKGYATASTDTGHRTERGFFEDEWIEGHPQRVSDFLYRAHHLMAQTSKKLVGAFYGKSLDRAYYNGCSSGGWEGLTEAQRYPDDYDGIVAGAPAINFVRLQSRGILQAQMSLQDPQGNLTGEQVRLLIDAAVNKCDARDGLKDGLIDDPRTCDFDPAELLCRSGQATDCLTAPQVARAAALYGPVKSRGGLNLYPGAALGASPMLPPSVAPAPPGHSAMALMLQRKPDWDVNTFDPDKQIPELERELGAVADSMDPNLSRFRAHGGKLILYHGWADPLLSPFNTIDYYDSVSKTLGADVTDGFVKLFMVPGMGHCRGGSGPNEFDAVEAMAQWVEHGSPPKQILAAHVTAGRIDRTRPLCPYPQVARYKGTGSTDEATQFECRQ